MNYEAHKPEGNKGIFLPIEQETVDSITKSLRDSFGIDLIEEGVKISLCSPGDELFDQTERNYRESMGIDPNLTGELPGFVATIGDKHIAFFAIRNDRLIDIANRYAVKEGTKEQFLDIESAKRFISEMSINALLHEITHIAWPDKVDPDFLNKWREYVASNQVLRDVVIELQKDKYPTLDEIPVEEEALADAMVEVLSFGTIKSRLNIPGAVEALRGFINEKDIDVGLVNRITQIPPKDSQSVRTTHFNKYGEIVP